jgi:hypothetical protein
MIDTEVPVNHILWGNMMIQIHPKTKTKSKIKGKPKGEGGKEGDGASSTFGKSARKA